MFELLLVAALVWPAECLIVGDLYQQAAKVRDLGKPIEYVLRLTTDRRVQRALIHVYERSDMDAQAWRWFAVGMCAAHDRAQRQNIKQG